MNYITATLISQLTIPPILILSVSIGSSCPFPQEQGTPPPQQQWAGSGQQAPVQGYAASNPSQAPTQQKIAMGVPRVWATAEMRQGGQMNRYVNSW